MTAELVEYLARQLVEAPDAVRVEQVEREDALVLQLYVAEDDLGKVIGRQKDVGPAFDVLWGILMDSIHHRGQFSVYLRMAGGKVPSIYGPSADEPWM